MVMFLDFHIQILENLIQVRWAYILYEYSTVKANFSGYTTRKRDNKKGNSSNP
jgi:hypothetical protein